MKQIQKPWGKYELLLEEPNYKVKRITIKPKQAFSKQYHKLRDEYWVVVSGEGLITRNNESIYCDIGYDIDIPKHTVHRAQNTSETEDFVFIEIQTGDCKEEDIVRLEDDYGR